MNIRRLAAWAVIFFSLLAYVLVFEKPALELSQPTPRGDYEKVFDLSPGDIDGLTIARPGKSVTIGCENLKWRIIDPPGAKALPEQCQSMVTTVRDTVLLSVIEESPADLAQFGLDEPALTISVVTDDGRRMTLKLGKKSPSGVSLYGLDVERGRVVLVGTYIRFSATMFLDNVKGPPGS